MTSPVHLGRDGEVTLYCGDCLDVLPTLAKLPTSGKLPTPAARNEIG